ncbi:MAG: OPT family oligopeptide transporter [Candidatus Xenobia bacterium]
MSQDAFHGGALPSRNQPSESLIDERDPRAEAMTAEIPGDEFVPYIPASKIVPEFSLTVIVLGALQAIVFGIADAYLGLKVGITVGASIPAAVISMAVLRGVLKRNSILENNLVQNMASVGESLAGGAVFTIPALYILSDHLRHDGQLAFAPDLTQLFFVATLGGLLGILFMIPMRRFLIVKEHGRLKYPEGTACAEVLIAGDKGGDAARTVFSGILVSGAYRFCMAGLGLFKENISWPLKAIGSALKFDMLPSLLAVGFILGIRTCSIMMAGAALGWFVIIPLIHYFGAGLTLPVAPAIKLVSLMTPSELHSFYLRYIGAGAVVFGGLVSLVKAIPTMAESINAAVKEVRTVSGAVVKQIRTYEDIPLSWVAGGAVGVFVILGAATRFNPAGFLGALLAVVFAFFFVTVASRIVGIVGTTSMPLSGMTIGALLTTCLILHACGIKGAPGMVASLVVGAIVCIAISMGGDISQDLKIGFLVGATPRWVQITQMIAVLISASFVGLIVQVLSPLVVNHTLAAPQANLMFMISEGVMNGNLPWVPVCLGMGIAACVELMGVASLPFAVGLYLPLDLTATLFVGGVLHAMVMGLLPGRARKEANDRGLLVSSGLVAGDALVGVAIALMAAANFNLPERLGTASLGFNDNQWVTVVLFALLCLYLCRQIYMHGRRVALAADAPEKPSL